MKSSSSNSTDRGFTLVELLVSIAIFTVITTVSVFSNSQFNGGILLTNLAYEMALTIRQAQFYGITVRQGGLGDFDSGYGVSINLNNPTSYVLFEDKNRNRVFNTNEELEIFTIQRGNRIAKICVRGDCTQSSHFENSVDISFIRPNPDTYITVAGTGSCGTSGALCPKADICISSPGGNYRRIVVERTGQIYVKTDGLSMCAP